MVQLLMTALVLGSVVGLACGWRDEPLGAPRVVADSDQNPAVAASSLVEKRISAPTAGASKQTLRMCNGYGGEPLWATRVPGELITQRPLAFKECRDFDLALQEADKIDFRAGSRGVGIFTAKGVPKTAAGLLLVVHGPAGPRRSALFQSHAYVDLGAAQVAVIDAYSGPVRGHLELADWLSPVGTRAEALVQAQSEVLQYNSVIAVNPGKYAFSLISDGGNRGRRAKLEARAGEHYVVMRVGGPQGRPEELVLFGSTAQRHVLVIVLTAVFGCFFQGM